MRQRAQRGQRGQKPPSLLSLLSILSILSCADPGSPGASLDPVDRDIVAEIIARNDPTDVGLGPYAKLVAGTLTVSGAVPGGGSAQSAGPGASPDTSAITAPARQMSAAAVEIVYDIAGADGRRYTGTVTEVVGWSGLDERTRSVGEMFSVGAWSDDTARIAAAAYEMSTLDVPAGFAFYAKPPGPTLALALGRFTLAADRFSAETASCGAVGKVQCEFTTGSMDATFAFRVEDPASADVYVQPKTVVTALPAVKVRLISR